MQDSGREPDSIIIPLHSPDSVVPPAAEEQVEDLPVPDFTAETAQSISEFVAAIGESFNISLNNVHFLLFM